MDTCIPLPNLAVPAAPTAPSLFLGPANAVITATKPTPPPADRLGWLARWYGHAAEMSIHR